jgi:putative DNA primase/helicase
LSPNLDFKPSRRVCLANGTFDMDNEEFTMHSAEDCLISRVDYSYDETATCPIYERVVREIFAHEDEEETQRCIDLWEEYLSMTMFEYLDCHKFLVLKGYPRTGKSTLLHVARVLHSSDAVSSVAVHDFGSERYKTTMVGKLLNVTGEVGATSHVADDFLKQVTGGDPVQVRYLFQETFSAVLPTRFIIACNELFRIRDTSGAIESRMLILPCDHVVPEHLRDADLWKKLSKERSGIFNRIAKAWPRLRDRGSRFIPPKSSAGLIDQFSVENNHVLQWVRERTLQGLHMADPSRELPEKLEPTESHYLYIDFTEWAREQGYKQISSITFGNKLNTVELADGTRCEIRNKRLKNGLPIKIRPLTLFDSSKPNI